MCYLGLGTVMEKRKSGARSKIYCSHRQESIARASSGRVVVLRTPLAHGNGVCARDQAAPHRRRLAAVESILESLAGLGDAQQRISRGAASCGCHGGDGVNAAKALRYSQRWQ